MSFPGAIHICDLQEEVITDSDFGEPGSSWSTFDGDVPCRAYREGGGYAETKSEPEKFIQGWKLMLPYGRTVTISNRIANVRDKRGTTLISTAAIKDINHDPGGQFHHQELWLSEVKTH